MTVNGKVFVRHTVKNDMLFHGFYSLVSWADGLFLNEDKPNEQLL